jgi:flagellar hook protein FlgE
MTISSSLNAGVMGLNAHATRLGTISDNIANSATNGYKRSQAEFSSLVLEQRSAAYSAGGVSVDTFKDIGASGSIISTGNAMDFAVSGRGLLPVTTSAGVNASASDRSLMLTPTGSFFADQNGNLRNQSGQYLLGWPTDTNGEVGGVSRNSGTDLEPVNILASQFVASPTSEINIGGINLPADATNAGANGDPYILPVEYYDNLGRAQTVSINFTPVVPGAGSSNQWTAQIFDSAATNPAASIGDLAIEFDDSVANGGTIDTATANNGATYSAATGIVTVSLEHGDVEIYLGRQNDDAGIKQLAAPYSPSDITKNGAPISDLESVQIDEQGFLQAIYDTGFRRSLYQIPVGDVPNINALTARDGQAFSVSANSGDLYLWDANTGPVGGIAGFSLMESTTDIASELTDLIETQRAYSSNAKIVQTVDEMLQETTNLKR